MVLWPVPKPSSSSSLSRARALSLSHMLSSHFLSRAHVEANANAREREGERAGEGWKGRRERERGGGEPVGRGERARRPAQGNDARKRAGTGGKHKRPGRAGGRARRGQRGEAKQGIFRVVFVSSPPPPFFLMAVVARLGHLVLGARRLARRSDGALRARNVYEPVDAKGDGRQHQEQQDHNDGDDVVALHAGRGSLFSCGSRGERKREGKKR